jgi:hypothetical protein
LVGHAQVLLEMNLSVPETREVMENAGSVGDVSKWSRTMLAPWHFHCNFM